MIEAFKALAALDNTQVILTTHSPAIVKMLDFDHIRLIRKQEDMVTISNINRNELPYPSLNEVNYLAFYESNDEYHNELYGFIESENKLAEYKAGRPMKNYLRLKQDGTTQTVQIVLSEYIRHQIHHPENTTNPRFSHDDLQNSIGMMRDFIRDNIN